MGLSALFPQPRHLEIRDGTLDLAQWRINMVADANLPHLVHHAVARVQTELANATPAQATYPIHLHVEPTHAAWAGQSEQAEAYLLELGPQAGTLIGATPAGLYVGCQTLRQLLNNESAVPLLRIVDWPDFRYRGLYIESKWGPDLMSLDDWKVMVDYMASLKLNSLGVGVYGCWVTQYGEQTTEFMMLPFPEHPQLVTPKTLRYYSPAAQAWQTLEYLPRMVTEDFFGDLVEYAKGQNITVRPHFNSPGHSTLIPRVYPEISAQDATGTPKGYGYCLSNPRTYELLLSLYDSVVERYLRPHAIRWFHIGLDEVTGYVGINPAKPTEVLDPWCQCAECRQRPPQRQLQEYAVRVCAHLKQQGIDHITFWHDALESLDALNDEFVQMLADAGLQENVIIQWWRYHEPTLVPRREVGLRAWVTPMAGYWSNLFTQSYTSNINSMLLYGHRAGAEGADAYAIYDLAFDRNYTYLAHFSWNQQGDDLYHFKSRYARSKLAGRLDAAFAVEAFSKYDQAFDAIAWTETVLASLLYYWHTYPAARNRGRYPFRVVTDLANEHLRLRAGLERCVGEARAARQLFVEADPQGDDPLLNQLRAECEKVIGVWETFGFLLRVVARYRQAAATSTPDLLLAQRGTWLNEGRQAVIAARARIIGVMSILEVTKAPYLLPQILRDLSMILLYIDHFAAALDEAEASLGDGKLPLLPFEELPVNQANFDRFVSFVH